MDVDWIEGCKRRDAMTISQIVQLARRIAMSAMRDAFARAWHYLKSLGLDANFNRWALRGL